MPERKVLQAGEKKNAKAVEAVSRDNAGPGKVHVPPARADDFHNT